MGKSLFLRDVFLSSIFFCEVSLIHQPHRVFVCQHKLDVVKKKPGWLGYIGDEKLPSYIGTIINHYKDPY